MSNATKNKPEEDKVPATGTCPDPTPVSAVNPEAEAAKIIADAEAKAAAIVAAAEEKAKADAEAKAAAIVAAAEEKAKADAEAKAAEDQTTPKADPMEELVWYEAPLLPGVKKRDILVGVNGETIRIQRGVRVQIKRKFYEALQNAAKQEYAAFEAREEIKKQGEKALAAM